MGDDAQLSLPLVSLECEKLGAVTEEAGAMVQDKHIGRVGAATVRTHQRMVHGLASSTSPRTSTIRSRPLELTGKAPIPPLVRVYAYTMTAPPSERQSGAYRIQITGLGPGREPAHFDWSDGAFVVLAGYEQSLDVFALWDAGVYDGPEGVAWSRNCQVLDRTLYAALSKGVAEQRRHLRGSVDETVVACSGRHLVEGVALRWERTVQRLLESEPVPR